MKFLSRLRGISDDDYRRTLVDKAIREARRHYDRGARDEAREPILQLLDKYSAAGLDRLELLTRAEAELPEDPYWLNAIVDILTARTDIPEQYFPLILKQARRTPSRLDLWQRMLREAKKTLKPSLVSMAQEQCALGLAPFFPSKEESRWEAPGLEDEAARIFHSVLGKAVEQALHEDRSDPDARDLFKAAAIHYPGQYDVNYRLAKIIISEEKPSLESLQFVMEALLENQDDFPMKLWVAEALLLSPRHCEEGLDLLRQAIQENPGNQELELKLVSALKGAEKLADADIGPLRRWLDRNSEDQRSLELLADYYADKQSLEEEAVSIYRKAAASSPRRSVYLRLLGQSSASRADWADVIQNFEELAESGDNAEDVIMPLATAYSAQGSTDLKAVEIYRKALEMGSERREIHEAYCRHLFRTKPSAPESIAQFTTTISKFPHSIWAKLGMINHFLRTGDNRRALEGGLELLAENPGDTEALEVAGKALSRDFSRRQLALLANASPQVLRRVYERAHEIEPGVGPIIVGLARCRLSQGLRNEKTEKLLREACRKNPDQMDLRLEWADLLWELSQYSNAASLYREILNRLNQNSTLPAGITPRKRNTMLERTAQQAVKEQSPEDREILKEAANVPNLNKDLLVKIAHTLSAMECHDPASVEIIKKALKVTPADPALEQTLAEAEAASGNPTPAINLSIQMIAGGRASSAIAKVLRSALAANKGESIPPQQLQALRDSLDRSDIIDHSVLLTGMELIYSARPPDAEDLTILERLHENLPRNIRVRRWLARCMSAAGLDSNAEEIYSSLRDSNSTSDRELHVEMALTHARLGIRTTETLKVAKSAIQVRPDDPDLLFHLASIHLELGHYSTATRNFDKLLAVAPDRHTDIQALVETHARGDTAAKKLLTTLARLQIHSGNYDKALNILGRLQANYQYYFSEMMELYEEVVKALPDNPRPHMERAVLFRLAGRIDEALEEMALASELAPNNENIQHEFAELLAQKARSDLKDVETAIQSGILFLNLGEDEQALELASLVLRRNPKEDRALMLRARVELNSGLLGECQETLRKLTDGSIALDLFEQLARTYADRGDFLRAAEVLTHAMDYSGQRSELLAQLRDLYEQQNEFSRDALSRNRVLDSLSSRAQGRYDIREELGSGAMGVVYKAYDRELDEIVVLKILPEHFENNPEALARFRHEAKAARKLAHPNIVRIHDFGEESGRKHISMEYVSGGDLKQYLKKFGGRLSFQEALRIIREVTRALAHAHGEGVLHRDIKAANILLTPSGRVKLSDFGIASLLSSDVEPPPEDPEYVLGTPLYMSPEQFRGEQLSEASDIYSLGVLFYELVNGAPPFTKGSIAYKHQFTQPPILDELDPETWAILEQALAKRPEDRFHSAEEFLMALDSL